jgi:hypothetical protein
MEPLAACEPAWTVRVDSGQPIEGEDVAARVRALLASSAARF